MTITRSENGKELTFALSGRLDTVTSPELEKTLISSLDSAENLVLDFGGLDYISSAGLRVLLYAQKKMNSAGGTMRVTNVSPYIMEIFEVTGFSDILTAEPAGKS